MCLFGERTRLIFVYRFWKENRTQWTQYPTATELIDRERDGLRKTLERMNLIVLR